jgi:hypothetical protein
MCCKQTRVRLYNSNTTHTRARTIVSVTSANEQLSYRHPPSDNTTNSGLYTPTRYSDAYRVYFATLELAAQDRDIEVNEPTLYSAANTASTIPSKDGTFYLNYTMHAAFTEKNNNNNDNIPGTDMAQLLQ